MPESEDAEIWHARLGVRDYTRKCGFSKVVIGLGEWIRRCGCDRNSSTGARKCAGRPDAFPTVPSILFRRFGIS